MKNEAHARIKINQLLYEAGWRFFDNEQGTIYQAPLINKKTENIELLNTVSKVILDKQTTDL